MAASPNLMRTLTRWAYAAGYNEADAPEAAAKMYAAAERDINREERTTHMNGTAMVVPVTPKLAEELAGAARLIRMLDSTGRKGPTDQDHFVKTVDQLEALTVAVLAATSSTPLTVAVLAARFSLFSGGPLNKHIIECVAYLRDDARGLLAIGGFDKWTGPCVAVALNHLKTLEGLIRSAIVKAAEADLATLSGAGIDQLIWSATTLAKSADKVQQDRGRDGSIL